MTQQYETCAHRRGSGLAGVQHEWHDTPCKHCEADDLFFHRLCIALFVVAVAAIAIWRYA